MCRYIDDTKISHVDKNVVSKVIKNINNKFGEMTVTRSNGHTFVGTHFKLNDDGTVSIYIKEYIEGCIVRYDDEINNKMAKTPANGNLFNINVLSYKLSQDKADICIA